MHRRPMLPLLKLLVLFPACNKERASTQALEVAPPTERFAKPVEGGRR